MTGSKQQSGQKGFTLIEVIVSVSLFVVIVLSATSIFKLAIDGQRSAIATQNVQESLKFFLEVIAKEIRMAQKNAGVCTGIADDKIFEVTEQIDGSDMLYFKNYYGECVKYYLAADGISSSNLRFKISRTPGGSAATPAVGFISPAKIRIKNLHFIISSSASTSQPMVTINLNANAIDNSQLDSDMTLQTSITSRYYK